MNKKKLLLGAFLVFLAASVAQAEPEPSLPAFLENPPAGQPPTPFRPLLDCDSGYELGDMNFDEELKYDDLIRLLNCVFLYPTSPDCLLCVGDVNCDLAFSPSDLVILFRFYFGVYSEFPTLKLRCPN